MIHRSVRWSPACNAGYSCEGLPPLLLRHFTILWMSLEVSFDNLPGQLLFCATFSSRELFQPLLLFVFQFDSQLNHDFASDAASILTYRERVESGHRLWVRLHDGGG